MAVLSINYFVIDNNLKVMIFSSIETWEKQPFIKSVNY